MPEKYLCEGFTDMYKRDGKQDASKGQRYLGDRCIQRQIYLKGIDLQKVVSRKNGVTEDVRRKNSIVRGKLV